MFDVHILEIVCTLFFR